MVPGPAVSRVLLAAVMVSGLLASSLGPVPAVPGPHPGIGLTAHLTASPSSGVVPLNVSFTASTMNSTGTVQYSWSFGDGATTATSVPATMHTYTWIDVFQANVTATDELGETATASVNVTVAPAALAVTLVALPSSVAAGSTTYLEANATGGYPPYSFAWAGLPPGCVAADVASLSCTPSSGGGFTINVTTTDQAGSSRSAKVGLVVTGGTSSQPHYRPPPTGSFDPFAGVVVVGIVGGAAVAGVIGVGLGIRARRRR